ncbi:hypothetical protein [Lutibacter sp.]|uniref:hypothetical protein n=1 Tax=Lutibacter sp. TaxID=1925666 RepID=UPI0034A08DC0
MEISILIAKIIGIVYVSFGIGLLANKAFYKETISNLFENSGYLIIGGFIAIVFGVFIIENHNIWEANWTVIISIIGWIALLKGILLLAFPTKLDFLKSMFSNDLFLKLLTPLVLVFGLIFLYLGFMS